MTVGRRWLLPAQLVTGLGAIVAVRWWATRAGLDPLAIGAAFGLAMAALAFAGARPWRRPAPWAAVGVLAIGAAFGVALVAIAWAGAAIGGTPYLPGLGRPAAPFLPWVAITLLVASAEEALLRGRLFDAVQRAGGVPVALIVTTVVFALMHVPLYGWRVVPLDLAVGFALGGLRLATRGVVAPSAAHAVADLATWWL